MTELLREMFHAGPLARAAMVLAGAGLIAVGIGSIARASGARSGLFTRARDGGLMLLAALCMYVFMARFVWAASFPERREQVDALLANRWWLAALAALVVLAVCEAGTAQDRSRVWTRMLRSIMRGRVAGALALLRLERPGSVLAAAGATLGGALVAASCSAPDAWAPVFGVLAGGAAVLLTRAPGLTDETVDGVGVAAAATWLAAMAFELPAISTVFAFLPALFAFLAPGKPRV